MHQNLDKRRRFGDTYEKSLMSKRTMAIFFYVGTIKQICVQLHTELMLSAEPACLRPAHIRQLLTKPKLNQKNLFFYID